MTGRLIEQCGSDVVVLALTPGQLAALSRALAGGGGSAAVAAAHADIAEGAFASSLGNPVHAAQRVPLAVEADSIGPALGGTLREAHSILYMDNRGRVWLLDRYYAQQGIGPTPPSPEHVVEDAHVCP